MSQPFTSLLRLRVLKLLGDVPRASTARFLHDGYPAGRLLARRLWEVTMDTVNSNTT